MGKLFLDQKVPHAYDRQSLTDIILAICNQVNALSEGRLAAKYNAQASVPTGTAAAYAVGDFVPDSNCTVTNGSVRLGWVCTAAGTPGTLQEARALIANFGQITNSLGADVALNNVANYFDGPSIAQGTTGTWFVSGTITVNDTAGAAGIVVKLWDGTTVIASAWVLVDSANAMRPVSLSGYITSPAGNLRMSAKDLSSASGAIKFNQSGNSKDSTITAIRIG